MHLWIWFCIHVDACIWCMETFLFWIFFLAIFFYSVFIQFYYLHEINRILAPSVIMLKTVIMYALWWDRSTEGSGFSMHGELWLAGLVTLMSKSWKFCFRTCHCFIDLQFCVKSMEPPVGLFRKKKSLWHFEGRMTSVQGNCIQFSPVLINKFVPETSLCKCGPLSGWSMWWQGSMVCARDCVCVCVQNSGCTFRWAVPLFHQGLDWFWPCSSASVSL